jgi:hypothetical protein
MRRPSPSYTAPDLSDQEARAAAALIIARAATEAQRWFWRGTNHGWPPPWQVAEFPATDDS